MTYNVFGGTLNLTQPLTFNRHHVPHRTDSRGENVYEQNVKSESFDTEVRPLLVIFPHTDSTGHVHVQRPD